MTQIEKKLSLLYKQAVRYSSGVIIYGNNIWSSEDIFGNNVCMDNKDEMVLLDGEEMYKVGYVQEIWLDGKVILYVKRYESDGKKEGFGFLRLSGYPRWFFSDILRLMSVVISEEEDEINSSIYKVYSEVELLVMSIDVGKIGRINSSDRRKYIGIIQDGYILYANLGNGVSVEVDYHGVNTGYINLKFNKYGYVFKRLREIVTGFNIDINLRLMMEKHRVYICSLDEFKNRIEGVRNE